jgi:hypothetical protein
MVTTKGENVQRFRMALKKESDSVWYEKLAVDVSRKVRHMRKTGVEKGFCEEYLWQVARKRCELAKRTPIWTETEQLCSIRIQGVNQMYEDNARWFYPNDNEGKKCLLEPLMFLRLPELKELFRAVTIQSVLTDDHWSRSHFFYQVRDSMSWSEILTEFGYWQGGRYGMWSMFSGQLPSQKYRARARLQERRRIRKEQDDALDALIKEFIDNDSRDENGVPLWNPQIFAEGLELNREHDRRRAREAGKKQSLEAMLGSWAGPSVDGIKESIRDAVVKLIGTNTDDLVVRAMVGLPVCLAAMWRHHEWVDWALAISQYVNALGLSSKVVKYVLRTVKDGFEKCKGLWSAKISDDQLKDAFFETEEKMMRSVRAFYEEGKHKCGDLWRRVRGKKQSKTESSPFEHLGMMVGAAGGLIAVVLACIGVRGIPSSDREVTSFLTRFGLLGRCITSVEKIYEAGDRFVALLVRLVRVHILRQDPALVISHYEVHLWSDKVAKMCTTDFESNVRCNIKVKTQFDALYAEGDRLLKQLDLLKVPAAERVRFTKSWESMQRLRATVATSGAGHSSLRPAPVIAHFVGDSGAGKSSVLWPLFMDVLARMGVEDYNDATQAVYYRYAADQSKHWDGYHSGVKICVVDDIFTKKDSEVSPNQEVDEVLRMANTSTWPLPMANLSDKGNVYFRAPLVIWTSNREQFTFDSRTNPEAIITRISKRYVVRPKPEYSEKRSVGGRVVESLLRSKVSEALRKDILSIKDFVVFDEVNPVAAGREALRTDMTYDEMVADLWGTIDSSLERFEMTSAGIQKYFKKVVAEQKEKVVAEQTESRELPVEQLLESGSDELKKVVLSFANMTASCNVDPPREGGSAQGLWTHRQTVAKNATGASAEMRSWSDVWNGRYHYLVERMVNEQALSLHQVFGDSSRLSELSSAETLSFRNCLCSKRRLTVEEQREIVAHLVREGVNGAEERASYLSTFPLLTECTEHRAEAGLPYLEFRLEQMHKHYVRNESAASLYKACHSYFETESVLTSFSENLLVIVGTLAMCLAMLYGSYKVGTGTETHKLACDVLREEMKRRPLGGVQSHAEKTSGRASGRVEGKRGDGHTEGCMAALSAKLREINTVFCDGSDIPLAVRVRKFNEEDPEPWSCTCNSGRYQAILDQNASEIGALALQNLYQLEEKTSSEDWTHVVNVLFVKGRLALVNRHVSLLLKEDKEKELRIVSALRPVGYEFKVKNLRYMIPQRECDKEKDLMIVEFPRMVHQHRDIVKKFMTAEDMGRISEFSSVCITGYALTGEMSLLRQYFASHAMAVDGYMDMMDDYGKLCGTIRRYIKYKVQTSAGDCGAVVVSYDQRTNNKIIGIHAGGMNSEGYTGFCQPVTYECLVGMLELFKPRFEDSAVAIKPPVDKELKTQVVGHLIFPDPSLEGVHQEYGTINAPIHRSFDTKIRRSPLYGKMQQPYTAPAALRPRVVDGELRDPLAMARKKVEPVVNPELDQELLERSVDGVRNMICSNIQWDDMKVKSLQVAIEGVPGDDAYPALNRKSSAGFGWIGTKKKYLGDGEYVFDHPEVLASVEKNLNLLKKGERMNAVFVDTAKDERRDLERVEAMKTRMFSAGEMTFTLIFRMYFLGWAAHMWRHRRVVESCVGIDPLGVDWHLLANDLKSKGSHVVAGDFSNYDGSLPAEMLWSVFDIIKAFYSISTDEERRVRVGLWSELVNSWHVVGNAVYLWSQSNPSGCPITSLLNSVVHSVMARYVWLGLAREHSIQHCSLAAYREHVVHRNYGDDDVWNISNEVIGWFNQKTLTTEFAKIGMTYTDETKKGEVATSRTLSEIAFLKRTFRWEKIIARWVGPLNLKVILEMPMWIHASSDVYKQTGETLEAAWRELMLHSEQTIHDVAPVFIEAAETVGKHVPVEFVSRREVLAVRRQKEM